MASGKYLYSAGEIFFKKKKVFPSPPSPLSLLRCSVEPGKLFVWIRIFFFQSRRQKRREQKNFQDKVSPFSFLLRKIRSTSAYHRVVVRITHQC